MQKIKQLLLKAPLLTAAAASFAIAAVIFIFFSTEEVSIKSAAAKPEITPTVTLVPTEVEEVFGAQAATVQTSFVSPTTAQTVTQQSNTQQNNSVATNTPEPTHSASSGQASEKKTFTINLSINGGSVGSVTVDEGATQCDVLIKAQEQGKISQLLMRYVDSLGTNGVYQINGIGKENAIWWVYKVNGTSPTQGCSHVKANSGDTVEWEYQGN